MRFITLFFLLAALFGCKAIQPPAAPQLVLNPTSFQALPGWENDHHEKALATFLRSCSRWKNIAPEKPFAPAPIGTTYGQWQQRCAEAAAIPANDRLAAKQFFEQGFAPYQICNRQECTGLFTGYFEIGLRGSKQRVTPYLYPLYRKPANLVTADLGLFRSNLKGEQLVGMVEDGKFKPLPDRAAIERGYYNGKQLELAWVDDPVRLFFLHIQGSGQLQMADGSMLQVGYDGKNGHPYRALGAEMIARGLLTKENVNARSIKEWLYRHPEQAAALMDTNPSYVFFRQLPGDGQGPIGGQGVPVTPERTLAVDYRLIPYGTPLWLTTTLPEATPTPYQRLFIAQDTGGAIRGPVRGDVFFGNGERAETLAGNMKQQGQYYALLPR